MTKTCPSCGTPNTDMAKFCTSCGSNIKAVAHTQATSRQQTQGSGNQCVWCKQNVGFKEEEGKLDSKWGATAHRVKIYICNNCGYAHLFGLGRTIFDFD